MKIGKVSEPILKRSVLKYLQPNNEMECKGAAVGADCALFSDKIGALATQGRVLATATASVSGEKNPSCAAHAILRATNNLAAAGAKAFAVQLHIMPNWKRGFYYIAQKAKIQIALIYFDYKKKEIGIKKMFTPTDDAEADIAAIKEYYRGVTAKYPENFAI